MLRSLGWELRDVEAMAALRLDPTEPTVRSITPEGVWGAGERRVELEVKARLWTGNWEVYAKPRFTAKAWADLRAVMN